jgi:hypothetical protein
MGSTAHKRACALLVLLVAALGAAPAQAGGWRAFAPTSPWNLPAAQKGGISASNPFASQFTSYSPELEISGIAPDYSYGKPIFFAQAGDPAYVWTNENGWGQGDIRYQGEPIPTPAAAKEATGSDGHLTIVTPDRRYAYDMWRADAAGHSAAAIVRFDLAGDGVPGDRDQNTSARGSGAPILPTTIRAEEAVGGIDHALGLTVPSVAGDYLFPATHSDGDLGPESVKYGMLFVLRPDFPLSAGASVGERNIIAALKTYGAYVVDQGSTMGLDADTTHPELWTQAGMYGDASMPIHAGDWRLVSGTANAASPPSPRRSHRRVSLRAGKRFVWIGGKVRLRGKVRGAVRAGAHVRFLVRARGRWHRLRRKPVEANRTFATNARLAHRARAASTSGHRPLSLKHVRLRRGVRVLRVRAVVRGAGRSNVVRIRVRRTGP